MYIPVIAFSLSFTLSLPLSLCFVGHACCNTGSKHPSKTRGTLCSWLHNTFANGRKEGEEREGIINILCSLLFFLFLLFALLFGHAPCISCDGERWQWSQAFIEMSGHWLLTIAYCRLPLPLPFLPWTISITMLLSTYPSCHVRVLIEKFYAMYQVWTLK